MGPFDAALLAATVRLATPLLFASTGELVSERTGVLNIGLEGMMLAGAFFSFLGTYLWDDVVLGIFTGMAPGGALAALMGLLTITARPEQKLVGGGLNLKGVCGTTYPYSPI